MEPPTVEQELELLRSTNQRQTIESEEVLHELNQRLAVAESELQSQYQLVESTKQESIIQHARIEELESELQKERDSRNGTESLSTALKQMEEVSSREKRDLLDVIERTQAEKQSVQESLSSLRELHTALQTSHSTLEASLQETSTLSRTSLLRVQTLSSSISSLEASKTFLSAELESSRTEATTYRREKHEELITLQNQLESKSLEATTASSSLDKVKASYGAMKIRYEEMMVNLASVKEELATNESQFSNEISSMRRLVEMMEKREVERKARMEDVERALEEDRGETVAIEEEWKAELERERERSDALEEKCSELREALEQSVNGVSGRSNYIEGSPTASSGGLLALNQSAQGAVRLQKTGRSYAQVYSEYVKMQEDLANERAETKRLGEILSQILLDIEERAPLLREQRIEYDRLSTEATHLASQLAQALSDRDIASRHTESYRLNLERLSLDNTIMTSQLRDLGRQLRTVTRNLGSRDIAGIAERSLGDGDEEEMAIMKRAEESNDTDAIVSAHLVTFQSINDLQVQNQKLLRITREMGLQMERGEEESIARRRGEENSAVSEAHEMILRLKDEVESQRAKTEAFVRERDMFRRMLSQRGSLGDSNGVESALTAGSTGDTHGSGTDVDTPRILADVQANFDAYRSEIAIDTQRLRDDLTQSQHDANSARTELAKTKAQSEFLSERYRLLNETYELQSSEIAQTYKQTVQLHKTIERHDSASHKMTEELLQLRGTADQLRHENTNYKAEREVWKSVENRLIEENTALSKERSHLADLMRNLQTMQNELERAGNESRRRLEESVARLETQASELKEKLNQETDSNRQLSLRRDFDNKTYQDRIDKLTSDYSSTRESLLVAQNSQEHLQQRVTDLVEQISSKEEKLAIYEGRTSTSGASADSNMTLEQQLQVEVIGLRNDLRAAQTKLEQAAANVEQYQSISITQGESLNELHTTYDEYKIATDRTIAEKDAEISSIRDRLHILTADITASSTENSDLHRQIEEARTTFEKERKLLEDDLTNARAADSRAQTAQIAAQLDLRRQAQYARDSHDKYERELLAHAEDVKRLTETKQELKLVRARTSELSTKAEVAQANLVGSEASWGRQKTALGQEITDLKKRCDDLSSQYAVLHAHLETFGAQAAQRPAPIDENGQPIIVDEGVVTDSSNSSEQLREVIRYLRREKDIIDLQLEFSKQEATRLRQQLEFATRNLEESRQALVEERAKGGDSAAFSAQHAELLERIHTANLLRESNSTLRSENESNMRKVATLDGRLRAALAQLDPLREQVQTLQAEVESKEHHLKLLEEDNNRWKNRNQQILSKYERIDPEELQVLKNEIQKIQSLLITMEKERDDALIRVAEESKLAESMKSNWHVSQERFKSLQVQARAGRTEKDSLAKELLELKEKMATSEVASVGAIVSAADVEAQAEKERVTQVEKERLIAQASQLEAEKSQLEAQLRQELAERTTLLQALEERNNVLIAEKASVIADKTKVEEAVARLTKREKPIFDDNKRLVREAKERVDELAKLRKEFETNNAEAIEKAVEARLESSGSLNAPSDSTIEEIVQKRVAEAEKKVTAERETAIASAVTTATAQAQAEMVALRSQLSATPSAAATTSVDNSAALEAKDKLIGEFEAVKIKLAAEAKARETAITERLTKEITSLSEAAKLAASSTSAATTTAPPVDIDAIVKTRLASLETDRLVQQTTAIEAAVTSALAALSTQHLAELAQTKAQAEAEALAKNKVLVMQLNRQKALAAAATAKIAPSNPTASSPTSAKTPALSSAIPIVFPPAASLSAPLPPLTSATIPPVGTRGSSRGAARGTSPGRGMSMRGLGRGSMPGVPVGPSIRGSSTVPSLALRGVARGGGGILGNLVAANAASNASVPVPSPKRGREGDDVVGEADAAKRSKQGETDP